MPIMASQCLDSEWRGVLSCCICMDGSGEADWKWIGLPCGHCYHELCFMQANEHKKACPQCRTTIKGKTSLLNLYVENKQLDANMLMGRNMHTAAVGADASAAADPAQVALLKHRLTAAQDNVTQLREQLLETHSKLVASEAEKEDAIAHKNAKLKEYKRELNEAKANTFQFKVGQEAAERALETIKLQTSQKIKELDGENSKLNNIVVKTKQQLDRTEQQLTMTRMKLDKLERTSKLRATPHMSREQLADTLQGLVPDELASVLTERTEQVEVLTAQLKAAESAREKAVSELAQAAVAAKRRSAAAAKALAEERDTARAQLLVAENEILKLQQELADSRAAAGGDGHTAAISRTRHPSAFAAAAARPAGHGAGNNGAITALPNRAPRLMQGTEAAGAAQMGKHATGEGLAKEDRRLLVEDEQELDALMDLASWMDAGDVQAAAPAALGRARPVHAELTSQSQGQGAGDDVAVEEACNLPVLPGGGSVFSRPRSALTQRLPALGAVRAAGQDVTNVQRPVGSTSHQGPAKIAAARAPQEPQSGSLLAAAPAAPSFLGMGGGGGIAGDRVGGALIVEGPDGRGGTVRHPASSFAGGAFGGINLHVRPSSLGAPAAKKAKPTGQMRMDSFVARAS